MGCSIPGCATNERGSDSHANVRGGFARSESAPDMGCLPETLVGDAGLIYPASEPNALAQRLKEIKQRDRQAMSVAARRVANSLSWDMVGRQTAAAYAECLSS